MIGGGNPHMRNWIKGSHARKAEDHCCSGLLRMGLLALLPIKAHLQLFLPVIHGNGHLLVAHCLSDLPRITSILSGF